MLGTREPELGNELRERMFGVRGSRAHTLRSRAGVCAQVGRDGAVTVTGGGRPMSVARNAALGGVEAPRRVKHGVSNRKYDQDFRRAERMCRDRACRAG